MASLASSPRPPRAQPARVAVIDDFAAYAASLQAALGRCGVDDVVRFDSHDAALGSRSILYTVDLVFVDVYRHAAERAADPYLPGIGVFDVARQLATVEPRPRVIAYGSWARRAEVRLLVAELDNVEALYDSGDLLDHLADALAGNHGRARQATADDRAAAGIGPAAQIAAAITTAQALGAEEGEPFGETWRLICELDAGQESRRATGVPEAVRRSIGRRLVPLLDLPPQANYLDAIRVIQRLAHVGPT